MLDLIERQKNPKKVYRIDKVLKSNEHTVLRVPPYMCDLNTTLAKFKRAVGKNNIRGDLSLKQRAVPSVTKTDCERFNNCTVKIENDFWQKDGLIEGIIDTFVIELSGVESSD